MLGIENLKFAALTLINLGEDLEQKLEDGKFSFLEMFSIAGKSSKDVIKVLQSGSQLKAEFKDLTEAERLEIKAYIETELDLVDDKLESKIEKGFDLLESIASFLSEF